MHFIFDSHSPNNLRLVNEGTMCPRSLSYQVAQMGLNPDQTQAMLLTTIIVMVTNSL